MITLRAIWIAAKAARAARMTAPEAIELAALCVLTLQRTGRPSANLCLGQARALTQRAYARLAV